MDSSGATLGSMLPFFSSRKKRFMMGSRPAVVPARMLVLDVGATASRYAFRIPWAATLSASSFHSGVSYPRFLK